MAEDDEQDPEGTFGQYIQRRRRELRLSQREVAQRLGLDFTYLSKLENSRGEPPGEDTVRKLAAILGVDEEDLLARAGKVPSDLRARAQRDVEFARFLRRLPTTPDAKLRELYDTLRTKQPGQ